MNVWISKEKVGFECDKRNTFLNIYPIYPISFIIIIRGWLVLVFF